jgi:hypothetical protein
MKVLLALLLPACALAADFDTYWHDGKAELNGYRLTVSRYGQPRTGQAVLIYVTEPFSDSRRVKVDDPGKNPRDVVDVLKLNLVRDFQTGIYDYNTMVSVFVRTSDFSPVKTTFSSAEWCGHVFEELNFTRGRVTGFYNSYFDGETARRDLAWPANGITEDSLWILLRGLRGEYLKPGQKKTVPLLTGVYSGRLGHKQPTWTDAGIERVENIYIVKLADGRTGKFTIEPDYPHRITHWEMPPDISAELTGSARLEYWKLHDNGHESYLKELGLQPGAPGSSTGGR